MNAKTLRFLITVLFLGTLLITACAPAAQPADATPAPTATQAPAGLSPEQVQATVNAAVLTALAANGQEAAGSPTQPPHVVAQKTPTTAFTATLTSAPAQPAGNCRDGEVTGNMLNALARSPIADGQYATAQEVSVSGGPGFPYGNGGWWRWIQVTAPLQGKYQVFNVNVSTIHELRYCGTLDAVKAYVSQANTHIKAMQLSAADGAGNTPKQGEIPVVFIDPASGSVTFLVVGTEDEAPSLDFIKQHIEIVQIQP